MQAVNVNPSLLTRMPDSKFIKTPAFQSLLSPRMFGGQYPAYVKYNMPAFENQAVPCDPKGYNQLTDEMRGMPPNEGFVQENYPTSCGSGACGTGSCPASCGKGGTDLPYTGGPGYDVPPDYAQGDYNSVMNKVYNSEGGEMQNNQLPLGSMNVMDAQGNIEQPVVYTNFVYANQKSRLRANNDMIRGSLPIAPCQRGWFSVAVNPNLDLQPGALNVMGGYDNEQAQKLSSMINVSSGGVTTTLGGVNLAQVNMTPQYGGQYGAGYRDVALSTIPL